MGGLFFAYKTKALIAPAPWQEVSLSINLFRGAPFYIKFLILLHYTTMQHNFNYCFEPR